MAQGAMALCVQYACVTKLKLSDSCPGTTSTRRSKGYVSCSLLRWVGGRDACSRLPMSSMPPMATMMGGLDPTSLRVKHYHAKYDIWAFGAALCREAPRLLPSKRCCAQAHAQTVDPYGPRTTVAVE